MELLPREKVLELKKFLVEGNKKAIGIEIQSGLRYVEGEDDCTELKTIRRYSLEELADGDLIEVDSTTFCALVGDVLYSKDKKDLVDFTWGFTRCFDYSSPLEESFYKRVVILFKENETKVSDEESFIVKDNNRVVGVRIAPGYMGVGGSNTSGFSADSERVREYTLEQLQAFGPLWVHGMEIYALKNDTLYLRHTSENGEKNERTMDCQEPSCILCGDSIAYDTVSATRVSLILK